MKSYLLIPALLLSACATNPSPVGLFELPSVGELPALTKIHRQARARIKYTNYSRADFHVVPTGKVEAGNCAVAAATVRHDLEKAGYTARYDLCFTSQGIQHVRTVSQGYAFDVRFDDPISLRKANNECPSLGVSDKMILKATVKR